MSKLVYYPPEFPDLNYKVGIFLGGSIEMGAAEDWQHRFVDLFKAGFEINAQISKRNNTPPSYSASLDRYAILNPRRPKWDNSLEQSITNPQFFQQVTWELSYLEKAKHRVFYFAADTLSPISLLEFGTFHNHEKGRTYICWDKGYKRAGNLEIFCNRYGIHVHPDLESIVSHIKLNSTQKITPL